MVPPLGVVGSDCVWRGNTWSGRTWCEIRSGFFFILFHPKQKKGVFLRCWLFEYFLETMMHEALNGHHYPDLQWKMTAKTMAEWQGPMPLLESLVETTRNNPRITWRSPLEPNFTMQKQRGVCFAFVEMMFFSCTMLYLLIASGRRTCPVHAFLILVCLLVFVDMCHFLGHPVVCSPSSENSPRFAKSGGKALASEGELGRDVACSWCVAMSCQIEFQMKSQKEFSIFAKERFGEKTTRAVTHTKLY